MKRIWKKINELKLSSSAKNKLYLLVWVLVNILIGGISYLLVGRHILPGIDWMLVFMSCPAAVTGFFCGIIYLYNNEF